MNCSNCGTPTISDQQFCRTCGTELMAGGSKRLNRRFWALAMLTWMFAGLLVSMTGKMLDLRWMIFTGIFLMIGGMFGVAVVATIRQSGPRKRNAADFLTPDSLSRAETTNKLLPIGDDNFIPSVVEGTTELLKTPVQVAAKRNGI